MIYPSSSPENRVRRKESLKVLFELRLCFPLLTAQISAEHSGLQGSVTYHAHSSYVHRHP